MKAHAIDVYLDHDDDEGAEIPKLNVKEHQKQSLVLLLATRVVRYCR